MAEPDFILVESKGGGDPFVIDRANLNDSLKKIGVPELRAAGPVPPEPHVSPPKANAVNDGPDSGKSTTKKEG
jgi:hypothetical protein